MIRPKGMYLNGKTSFSRRNLEIIHLSLILRGVTGMMSQSTGSLDERMAGGNNSCR